MRFFKILLCAWMPVFLLANCSKKENSEIDSLVESRLTHLTNMTTIMTDNVNDCNSLLQALRGYYEKNKDDFGNRESFQSKMSDDEKNELRKKMQDVFLSVSRKMLPVMMKVQKNCKKEMTEISQIFQTEST
jgi:hypothetical protein